PAPRPASRPDIAARSTRSGCALPLPPQHPFGRERPGRRADSGQCRCSPVSVSAIPVTAASGTHTRTHGSATRSDRGPPAGGRSAGPRSAETTRNRVSTPDPHPCKPSRPVPSVAPIIRSVLTLVELKHRPSSSWGALRPWRLRNAELVLATVLPLLIS